MTPESWSRVVRASPAAALAARLNRVRANGGGTNARGAGDLSHFKNRCRVAAVFSQNLGELLATSYGGDYSGQ
jgi:hypothetical protein